jgi:hypothetical protein
MTSNTRWTKSGSPYDVTSDLSIYPGVILTIDPGVTVRIFSDKSIFVGGTLLARGLPADSIKITAVNTSEGSRWNTVNFIDASVDAVVLDDTIYVSGSIIEYTIIEGAKGNALRIESSAPLIRFNSFRNCIEGNTSTSSAAAITVKNSPTVYILGNLIERCSAATSGIAIAAGGSATVKNNTLRNNDGVSIFAGEANSVSIIENLIQNNSPYVYPGGKSGHSISLISLRTRGIIKGNRIERDKISKWSGAIDVTFGTNNILIEENLLIEIESDETFDPGDIAIVRIEDNSGTVRSNLFIHNKLPNSSLIWLDERWSNTKPTINYNSFMNNQVKYVIRLTDVPYPRSIDARNNYWNTTDTISIPGLIYDFYDNLLLGIVDWRPILAHSVPFPIRKMVAKDPDAANLELDEISFGRQFVLDAIVEALSVPGNDTLVVNLSTGKQVSPFEVKLGKIGNTNHYLSKSIMANSVTVGESMIIGANMLDTIRIVALGGNHILKKIVVRQVPQAPILLSPANGSINQQLNTTLTWNTVTGADSYRLQLSTNANLSPTVVDDSTLTTTSRFVDPLALNTPYYWRVSAKNLGGVSPWSNIFSFSTIRTTSVESIGNDIPTEYNLSQNYPNPFNPVTTIELSIPKQSRVVLTIFNSLGMEIEVLLNELLASGHHRIQWIPGEIPSGVYFYQLKSAEFTDTKKLLLLR